ncbi:MBL fold metallo-hydrolase [Nitrospira sp. Kam-Ns4a]
MSLTCGFETIGNASLICYDEGRPVLVTDPWILGPAYFGSWSLSHEIPDEQMQAILSCRFVWVSHGHPDHLSAASLERLRGKQILLPDHYGGRIRRDLEAQGLTVHVMPDRTWIQLSRGLRVLCVPDYNQDAVLLIELGGVLLVNTNDATDRGWGYFVRKLVRQSKVSFLLAISGYGDADMINFFDEAGHRILPEAAKKEPPGRYIAGLTDYFGTRFFVPFSSLHKYQRRDSLWANEYVTRLDDYAKGFNSRTAELLPAFIRYDCERDRVEEIRPPECPDRCLDPAVFGDVWSDPLDRRDVDRLRTYFQSIAHLGRAMDYVNFRVGGTDHIIELRSRGFHKGITFEVPRHSLLCAIEAHVFDDLLIGNFMKTTLHGSWGTGGLYPDFSPYVAKYADNGQARTREELRAYFRSYRQRAPLDFFRHKVKVHAERLLAKPANWLRSSLPEDSLFYRSAKRVYGGLVRRI